MPSNHLILCRPLLLLPSIFPSTRVFSNEPALCIRWPKYWSFSLSISPSNEHPGLISFRMYWLDLLAVQGTLKSLLQHHSSKASILLCSAFFIVGKKRKCTHSCPTLCHPMDYSLPGSSIHAIFQARVLEWVAIFFSRVSSRPRDWTQVSCIVSKTLYRLYSRDRYKITVLRRTTLPFTHASSLLFWLYFWVFVLGVSFLLLCNKLTET